MQYSTSQQNIFTAVKNTKNNIAVLATAGAGKTTTILQALQYIPRIQSTVFLSFSNAIVKELKTRVPPHIKAATIHSAGYGYIRNAYPHIKMTEQGQNKYFTLALNVMKGEKDELTKKDFRNCYLTQDICAYARQTLTDFTDKTAMMEMCNYYNIEYSEEDGTIELSMTLLAKWAKNTKAKEIDFVDMVYWPSVIPEIVDRKYDNLFLDEAQDTNKCQLQLIESMLKKNGRLISVGDDYQCIYGFSGADIDAFKRIRERPNTITLPLSTTFRCPKKVVKKAQEVCPEIEAYEHAKDGDEREGHWSEIREGDMVLSRVTRPLIALYFILIENNVKANVVGKDIESGLKGLMDGYFASPDTVHPSMEGVKYYLDTRLTVKGVELTNLGVRFPKEHPQYISLQEKILVLELILKKVHTPHDVIPKIREIFHEDKKAAKLMTIHRSKGLENDRVFVIEKADGQSLMPSKYAKQQWEHSQERNLMFVAWTRSKSELIYLQLAV